MTPNSCPHSRLEFLGLQKIPGDKPLRLYNCAACHTTVARHQYFRTGEEIARLMVQITGLRAYLRYKDNPVTPAKNFDTLEALINEVSRARTPEFWR